MQNKKKFELEIELKDFGPISSGVINLKPLTVLIGPNNSGKSYAAMLIHSILESYAPATVLRRFRRHTLRRRLATIIGRQRISKEIVELKKEISSMVEGKELEISKDLVVAITRGIFEEIYEQRLGNEIIRSFACEINELIRVGKKESLISLKHNSLNTKIILKNGKIDILEYPLIDLGIQIKARFSPQLGLSYLEEKDVQKVILEIPLNKKQLPEELYFARFIDEIIEICIHKVLEYALIPCYYLPAARSGILQGHKALAASVVETAPLVGIKRIEIPKFSGVVADFISSVLRFPESRGPFYQLARSFENELIKGEVVLRSTDEYSYPEMMYKFKRSEIPLHRASSTVSELAPLFLYLKYTIGPQSILVIEEPEAHLHPANQIILAKYIVKMIRQGIHVTITTHSDFLIEQLNAFIALSKVDRQQRISKFHYDEEAFIKPEEVSAYVFNFDKRDRGHRISEIEVSDTEGISQNEFFRIHESLYEESFKLHRMLLKD